MTTERFNKQSPAGWTTYGAFFLKRGNKLWHERRADVGAMLVIILFFILFFWPALFGGRFLLAGDPLLQSLPMRTAAWNAIRGGSLPLWTPLILSGYPMASMAQLGLAYPLTWGYLFLPGHWAEQIYVLAPYLLSPIFVYLYAREIGRSRMAALLAGLSFGYGGAMVCLIGIYGISSNSAMWLPLILFAIERSLRRRFAPSLLLAAGGYAMAILNGHGQYFVYTGIVAIAYGAFLTWYRPWVRAASSARCSDQRPIEETRTLEAMRTQGSLEAMRAQGWKRVRPLAVAIGAVALASGVSAFQIAESLRAAAASVRAELSYEVFTYGSFSLGYVWKSLLEPLHNSGDVSAYAPPLAFFLAVVAAGMTLLRKLREGRGTARAG